MITETVKDLYLDIHAALLIRYPTLHEAVTAAITGELQDFIDEQVDVAVFSGRVTDTEITESINDPEWLPYWREEWLKR